MCINLFLYTKKGMRHLTSDGKPRDTVSSRDSLETLFWCLGLGLGLDGYCLGLGLGLERQCLGLGLGLGGTVSVSPRPRQFQDQDNYKVCLLRFRCSVDCRCLSIVPFTEMLHKKTEVKRLLVFSCSSLSCSVITAIVAKLSRPR